MAIENMNSVVSEYVLGGGMEFQGTGQPLRGIWRDQGLEITAQAIEGKALPFDRAGLYLDRATLRGAVVITLRQAPESGPRSENTLRTERVQYREQGRQALVEIPGRLELRDVRSSPQSSHELVVTGSSGHIVVAGREAPRPGALERSQVAGPVEIQLNRRAQGGTGTTTTVIKARGDLLVYDVARREVRLSGNVEFDAEQTAAEGRGFAGQFVADTVVFVLDETNALRSVRWEGSPGQGTLREAPPAR